MSVFLQIETVLQIVKLYIIVKRILKLIFQTVFLCRSEYRTTVSNVSFKILFTTVYNLTVCKIVYI